MSDLFSIFTLIARTQNAETNAAQCEPLVEVQATSNLALMTPLINRDDDKKLALSGASASSRSQTSQN